jgi:hypothetical protein
MRFLEKSKDGGPESHVTGYFLVEIKSLFSIVLLHFGAGTREAFHNHAFNALTLWLRGTVEERVIKQGEESHLWAAGQLKYTPRRLMHKIIAPNTGAWALSFRGPWVNTWRELINNKITTLTHGRQVIAEKG